MTKIGWSAGLAAALWVASALMGAAAFAEEEGAQAAIEPPQTPAQAVAAARQSLDVFIHTILVRDDFDYFVRLDAPNGPWRRAVYLSRDERLFVEPPDLPQDLDDEAYFAALVETPVDAIADWAFSSGAAIAMIHGAFTLRLDPTARIPLLQTTVEDPPYALQPIPTPDQIAWHRAELEGLRRARDIVATPDDDAAMKAAMALGAATIDHFLERRAALGSDAATYLVKLHVAGPDIFKWLFLDEVEGDLFKGRWSSPTPGYPEFDRGAAYAARRDQLVDWMIMHRDDREMIEGSFTTRVLVDRDPESAQAQSLQGRFLPPPERP